MLGVYYSVSYKKRNSGRLKYWYCYSEEEAFKMPENMVIDNKVYRLYGITKHDLEATFRKGGKHHVSDSV